IREHYRLDERRSVRPRRRDLPVVWLRCAYLPIALVSGPSSRMHFRKQTSTVNNSPTSSVRRLRGTLVECDCGVFRSQPLSTVLNALLSVDQLRSTVSELTAELESLKAQNGRMGRELESLRVEKHLWTSARTGIQDE